MHFQYYDTNFYYDFFLYYHKNVQLFIPIDKTTKY